MKLTPKTLDEIIEFLATATDECERREMIPVAVILIDPDRPADENALCFFTKTGPDTSLGMARMLLAIADQQLSVHHGHCPFSFTEPLRKPPANHQGGESAKGEKPPY